MKRKKIYIISGLVILVVCFIVIRKQMQPKGLAIITGNAKYRTITESVFASGKIQPEIDVSISSDVSGEIISLFVREGDTVESGELLAKIDPEIYLTAKDRAVAGVKTAKVNLQNAKANLIQSKSRRKQAESNYERNKNLYTKGIIGQTEWEQIESAYEIALADQQAFEERILSAKYAIETAQATLKEAEKGLILTNISSPTNGVISKLKVEQGERVVGTAQMAGTEMMILSNFKNMEVLVTVSENDILEIEIGDSCFVEVDAYGERKFDGIVTEMAKSSTTSNVQGANSGEVTEFEIKVRILESSYKDLLKSGKEPFLPGLSASVEIITRKKENILSLPIEAVTARAEKHRKNKKEEVIFLFQQGIAKKQKIKTGIQDARFIEISEGLDSLSKVIVGPFEAVSESLQDEAKVFIQKKGKGRKFGPKKGRSSKRKK